MLIQSAVGKYNYKVHYELSHLLRYYIIIRAESVCNGVKGEIRFRRGGLTLNWGQSSMNDPSP